MLQVAGEKVIGRHVFPLLEHSSAYRGVFGLLVNLVEDIVQCHSHVLLFAVLDVLRAKGDERADMSLRSTFIYHISPAHVREL